MLSTLYPETARRAPVARPRPAARWLGWLPLALIALLYLGASAGPALFDQNEAQYAGAVREMLNRPADYQPGTRTRLERGSWYVPTNDGIPRLQKPPVVYWLLMASMRVFGVNEFGARLPNALASLLWFWGTFLLGRRIAGPALGLHRRDDPRHDGRGVHLLPPHRARTLPRRDAHVDLLVLPRRLPGTGARGQMDVRGVGIHGAGHRLQGAARRAVSAGGRRIARVASPGDAARLEKTPPTRRAADVRGTPCAVVRGGRGALSRFPARPVPQRTTRPRPQPPFPHRQRPRALCGVLAGAPRLLPAVDVFHPGGDPLPPRG